jgi:hypothetical protein
LNQWEATYGAEGLAIIGVHGVFYQGQRAMEDSAAEWGITYRVANDHNRDVWGAYELFAHPSYALINPDGSLERKAAGVVVTSDTEQWIQDRLGQ